MSRAAEKAKAKRARVEARLAALEPYFPLLVAEFRDARGKVRTAEVYRQRDRCSKTERAVAKARVRFGVAKNELATAEKAVAEPEATGMTAPGMKGRSRNES